MSNNKEKRDALAAIGGQRIEKENLEPLPPCPRNLENLSRGVHDPKAVFESSLAFTKSDLDALLQDLIEKHQPFEKDLAPSIKEEVTSQKITDFNWRIATDEDWKDFPAAVNGAGEWEPVKVPHYGEPLGPASTFYQTAFEVTEEELKDRALFLKFKGVDYKAHVFVNGCFLGSHEGFFASFEFDASRVVRVGKNQLFIRVDNDNTCLGESSHHSAANEDGDKIFAATNQGYDEPLSGWHHCPPGMGIYQDVLIESRPKFHISDIFVRPLEDLENAEIWIEVNNAAGLSAPIQLELSVYGQNFEAVITENQLLN